MILPIADTSVLEVLFRRHVHTDDGHDSDELPQCEASNEYDGRETIRIVSIFIVLLSSFIGTFFPMMASRYSKLNLPEWCFAFAKYFGSGVIVATGFIHLLQPANEYLTNECLGGVLAEYPWAFGICMMSLFTLFFVEINSHFFIKKTASNTAAVMMDSDAKSVKDEESQLGPDAAPDSHSQQVQSSAPGQNHFGHDAYHQDVAQATTLASDPNKEKYMNQLISLFILEFGVVFHSILVGLALAVSAGDEYNTLFIVIVFHQMFEGMGLGARISEISWGANRRWTPWLLGMTYSMSTPLAIAAGLGVRHSFVPGSRTALIVNGVFDSISAGILLYTGLIELMAHEFLFSNSFKGEGGFAKMLQGYAYMCLGAGLMALLGKWA